MLTKLKVENYKSLRNIEIELGKFNVLIGANASGKSNFLDCLAFLSETIGRGNINKAFEARGGFERIIFGGETKNNIKIFSEFLLDRELFQYTLSVGSGGIIEEGLVVGNKKTLISRTSPRKGYIIGEGDKLREVGSNANASLVFQERNEPSIQKVYQYLISWKLYQFITSDMRKVLPARKSFDLGKTGDNLALVLLSLNNERRKVFHKVEDILKQGIAEIDELQSPLTDDGQTYIALREKGFERAFDYYQLSDGTLKLLAYITAIALEESKLVCFEEPENFIHHRLLELLVEILRKSDKQVLLSTHSPYFVDFVQPEEVIVLNKEGNETKVQRIENPEKLREVLREIGLGELWHSGEIGGIP